LRLRLRRPRAKVRGPAGVARQRRRRQSSEPPKAGRRRRLPQHPRRALEVSALAEQRLATRLPLC